MKCKSILLLASMLLVTGCNQNSATVSGNEDTAKTEGKEIVLPNGSELLQERPSILNRNATQFFLYHKTVSQDQKTTPGIHTELKTDVDYIKVSDEEGNFLLGKVYDRFNQYVLKKGHPKKGEQIGGALMDLDCIVLTYRTSEVMNYFYIPEKETAPCFVYWQADIQDNTDCYYACNLPSGVESHVKEITALFESAFQKEKDHQHTTSGKNHLFVPGKAE